MINTEEQKQKEVYNHSAQLSSTLPTKRYPIVCKFWMMGNCLKEEKCEYLHSEKEKRELSQNRSIVNKDTECPMYSIGFCKNGSICNFKHTERNITEEEIDSLPELPIWYLEYVLGKPISLIFEDFEEQNKNEVEMLVKKVLDTTNKTNKNYYSNIKYFPNQINSSAVKYTYPHQGYSSAHQQYDMYAEKKDFIVRSLEKKVRYFFIRNMNMNYVKFAMEHNYVINIKHNSVKLKEAQKSCDEVILIMFDDQSKNFNGFCKFKKEITDKDQEYSNLIENPMICDFRINQNTSYIKIEWHWKTKLSYDKVELLKNPLNNDELVIYSKDCQEISMDIGNYICRLMIKRLSKTEVKEYIDKRRLCEDVSSKADNKDNYNTFSNTSHRNINLNNLIFEEISRTNLNHNLVFANNDYADNRSSKNLNNNNIIVTNISNLQVNISQNSYQSRANKKTGESDRKKRNKRSRSRSRHREYQKSMKDMRRSRSKSVKRHERKKYKRKYSDENDIDYDSDETVIMKEEASIRTKHKIDLSQLTTGTDNLSYQSSSKRNTDKPIKNTLFSNAMKKIAMQSVKPK